MLASPAYADVTFGDNDVRTIFYISKSDDRNRVDYAIRLDQRCQPVGTTPVYAYWHRFEPGEATYGDLNSMDRRAYGISRQTVRSRAANGSWVEMHLAGFPEQRFLVLAQRGEDGSCHARAQLSIDERDAFLDHIHVQLGWVGVDRIVLHGREVTSGTEVSETRRPPRGGLVPRLGG